MVDALGRHGDDVKFDGRVEEMKELCQSDDEEDQDIVAFDQQAQENWHSDWVMELIRITKPGKAIIIGKRGEVSDVSGNHWFCQHSTLLAASS